MVKLTFLLVLIPYLLCCLTNDTIINRIICLVNLLILFHFVPVGQTIGTDGLPPHFLTRHRFGLLSGNKMGYFPDLPGPKKDTFPALLQSADLNQS